MAQRTFLYCLVPAAHADALLEPLREHFSGDPHVTVLVERRAPAAPKPAWLPGDDPPHRRAPAAERDVVRALPPALRRQARHLKFVQRLEPVTEHHQHTSLPDLLAAIRGGEPEAASELWWRYSERIQMRLRTRLGEMAAATADYSVLGRILDELDAHDPGDRPFHAWLDEVVDRYAVDVGSA